MVGIGITTKNRWDDLRETLCKLADFGWGDLPTLIFDDASHEACPFDLSSFVHKGELKRYQESKGCVVRRNQLAEQIATKYYLSLDDDSFPVAGSLDSAIEFAESCTDLLCLSFPIYNPTTDEHQVRSLRDQPYRVRSFIGCGHLLHRQRFLDLGGYREELVHQGEEIELSARGFQRGFYCYHYPALQIHHTASNAGRNLPRMDFYGARNNVLWNDWFVPSRFRLVKQTRTLIARTGLLLKTGRIGHARGQIAGFRDALKYQANRRPMSLTLYREWRSLPAH
jgi:Predicted glycosyltransferases